MLDARWLGVVIATACGGSPNAGDDAGGSDATTSPLPDDGVATEPAQDDGDDDGGTGSDDAADSSGDGSDATDTNAAETTGGPEPTDGPRYDQLQQKSAHNSYQRHEAIVDQLVYHRVRSIEIDIHVGKTFEPTVAGRWYVYHDDITDDETSCRTLEDCLEELVVFAEAVPEHEVVTLWIDLKDPWDDEHAPEHLDAAIDAVLGDTVITPAELVAGCPGASDLASALSDPACGWPSATALRGRVIVALTGGGINSQTSKLSTYLEEGERAFIAPDAASAPAIDRPHPDVGLYNASAEEIELAVGVADAGFIARVWDLNESGPYGEAQRAGVHHLATDMVNLHEDPWTITHAADGWPFTCVDGCAPAGPEPGDAIGIEVASGDIWGTADDFLFQHADRSGTPAGEWVALVSSANSHVEPFAKACLMARASLSPSAAYFAVCRPADEEPLRAQWRASDGAESQDVEDAIVASDTVSPTSVAWIRLTLADDGTCATAWGARHFDEWEAIATQCFDDPLVHQGLAASSHDAGTVRLLFVSPLLDGTQVELANLTQSAIGSATGSAFAGPIP